MSASRCWFLAGGQSKNPSIDTAFSLFQRRRQIKQETSQSGIISVMDRIKLEKSKAESSAEALNARANQVEFWKELSHDQPSLARLESLGDSIAESIQLADAGFAVTLRLSPMSVSTCRSYAKFLLEVRATPSPRTAVVGTSIESAVTGIRVWSCIQVANNNSKALRMLEQAEELEQMLARGAKDDVLSVSLFDKVC